MNPQVWTAALMGPRGLERRTGDARKWRSNLRPFAQEHSRDALKVNPFALQYGE
jgi:hypothetical protein